MQKASSSAGAVTGQNNSFRDGCGHFRPAPAKLSNPLAQPWCSSSEQVEQRRLAEYSWPEMAKGPSRVLLAPRYSSFQLFSFTAIGTPCGYSLVPICC